MLGYLAGPTLYTTARPGAPHGYGNGPPAMTEKPGGLDKRLRIAGIAAAAAAAVVILASPGAPPPLPDPLTTRQGNDSVEVLATGLDRPRALAFGDGAIYIAERDGRVLVYRDGRVLDAPLASFRVPRAFDGGLLGIAAHPDFESNRTLYAYHTYVEDGRLWNKVVSFTESGDRLASARTLLDGIPGSEFSNGGAIKFGPDGYLYVATGSVSDSSHLPQDPGSPAGKILRMSDDGSVPETNPEGGSHVFASGFRNPQGMAWDGAGNFYVSDAGPTKNDEINVVLPGRNYGWPEQECSGEGYEDPILCYDPAIEPGGIAAYRGGIAGLDGRLLMASLRASNLYSLDTSDPGLHSQKIVLSGVGRIRDVAQGPGGDVYILTSNTDGRGFPSDDDDRLLRILR